LCAGNMDTLPNELVHCIIDKVDGLTLPLLCCVCWQWRHLVESMCAPHGITLRRQKRSKRPHCNAPRHKHSCGPTWTDCVAHYIVRTIRAHRWGIFEWLTLSYRDVREISTRVQHQACSESAAQGDLARLQHLYKRGFLSDANVCNEAAKYGHLDVLKWATANGCPWGYIMCVNAAKNGHAHVLEWVHARGAFVWYTSVFRAAAEGGYMHIMQLAKSKGITLSSFSGLCASAAKAGRTDMIQWLRAEECQWGEYACASAAKGGHLQLLQWLRASGCPWDALTSMYAAKKGHYDVLMWAHDNGCQEHCTSAYLAQNGNMQMLEWAKTEAIPLHEDSCRKAARGGHLQVLQWLRNNGCMWDASVYEKAARNGHSHVVKWAWANGCPRTAKEVSTIVKHCDSSTVAWLLDNGLDWYSDVCPLAFEHLRLDLLLWARDTLRVDIPQHAWASYKDSARVTQWAALHRFTQESSVSLRADEKGCPSVSH